MPLTPAQKVSPFRATSSGLVIERSLASGNEEEWAHWWDLGQLAKGMGKAGYVTAGILKSAAEGFARQTLPDFWLERLLSVVPEVYKTQSVDWAVPLTFHPRGLEILHRHGVDPLARVVYSYERHPSLWLSHFHRQVFNRSPSRPPQADSTLAARVDQLAGWVKSTRLDVSSDELGLCLESVWLAIVHGVGGNDTEKALDDLACLLIEKGASPAPKGSQYSDQAWEAHEKMRRHHGHLKSLSTTMALKLLGNLEEGKPLHRSLYHMFPIVEKWEPERETVYKAWLSKINPWQTTRSSSLSSASSSRYESLADAWWCAKDDHRKHSPEAALPWLKQLAAIAQQSPAPLEWFSAVGQLIHPQWSKLPEGATTKTAQDHGRDLALVTVELRAISVASQNSSLAPSVMYALNTLGADPTLGMAAIKAFVQALEQTPEGAVATLEWLMSPRFRKSSDCPQGQHEWKPSLWWGQYLSDESHVKALQEKGVGNIIGQFSWVTLMNPPASANMPVGQLSQAQQEWLKTIPLTDPGAQKQAWNDALKIPEKLVRAVEIGLPVRAKHWSKFMSTFQDSFSVIHPDAAQHLLGLADALIQQGWSMSGGEQGNVLELLRASRRFPVTLLDGLLTKGASMEGMTECTADTEEARAFNHRLGQWRAAQAVDRLEQVLDVPLPAARPRVRM